MRRDLLKSALVGTLAGATGLANAKSRRVLDSRLHGVWQSDRERTLKHWRTSEEMKPDQYELFAGSFGRIKRTYTPESMIWERDGQRMSHQYWVIHKTPNSVFVSYGNPVGGLVEQLFIEQGWLYCVSGYNLEFFKRIEA
jgi:hypothetical protein